ncbi:SRPBCC family protein [Janibacter alittae]|uniref:SRPBCC family protein n=1 Tax=Janibacter alittae TaxID=3115209 RepID=A0ABZ2MFW1_9MICO
MTPVFVFHDRWPLAQSPQEVVRLLADAEGYPRWWPQVRSVERLDAASGRARIRSLLPLTLDVVLTREVEDRDGGVLRVRLSGDLVGWARWTVHPHDGGSVAVFEQEVRVAPRLERAATLASVVLRANHAWMMRQGRRGLAREITRRR